MITSLILFMYKLNFCSMCVNLLASCVSESNLCCMFDKEVGMDFSEATQKLVDQARGRDVSDVVRLTAARVPEKLALVYDDIRCSFAQLDESINRVANAMLCDGIGKGDRVAIISHNNFDFVVLRFATARIGAILAPINFMLNAVDISYIIDLSGARFVIAEDTLCETVSQAIALATTPVQLRRYIRHSGVSVSSEWQCLSDWREHTDTTPVRIVRDESLPAQMMFTSGTESRPKGVLLSTQALFANFVSCIIEGGMDENDVELHALPLYHCAQLDCFLTPDLYLGATSIIADAPEPGLLLEIIEREQVTKLFCPPTVWISLLRHSSFETRDLSSLKKGYYGASIMPTSIIEELLSRMPGLQLYNFYGQTELAPVATILKPSDQLTKLGSAGKPALNIQTRVVGEQDQVLKAGCVGEIVHRSIQATSGYYGDDIRTTEAFKGGWFHSGDLGYFDEDGYLYLVDRKKDMIKSGGENVSSREVEEQIFAHASVNEVAVFGVPHPKWIEAVVAVVVLRDNSETTETDLLTFCHENLTSYKRPKQIFIADTLPKNASGKILKRDLREHYQTVFDDEP